MNSIKNYFKISYPERAYFFTAPALRSRLYRILRAGLRKLRYYQSKYGKDTVP
jgi:hypothetical protein